jgi:hypothetical protein
MKHGHPSPAFLQFRLQELERLIAARNAGDETDGDSESDMSSDAEDEKSDETTSPEPSPGPTQ